MGLFVAAGLLGGVEAAWRLARGAPPPSSQVIQISMCELVVEGDGVRMAHPMEPRQDVVVPPKGDRPRLVTLGGSSVRHSWAKDPEVDFPLWLQRALPEVEVVNLGTPGQTTLGVLDLMPDLHLLQPDLVLLYTGHNDFSEPVFQGRVGGSRLWMLPVHRVLGRSWIYATLRGTAVSLAPFRPSSRRGLLATDDPRALEWAHETQALFERQLAEIVASSPAPVAVSTLLRNADYHPSGLLALPAWPQCAALARQLPVHQPPAPAAQADKVDQACGRGSAMAAWYRSLHARAQGDTEAAARHFADSLDRDPLPLRAPLAVDDAIRALARERDLLLLDPAAELGPLPPGAWFDDTLHPNALGAQRLAEVMAPALRRALVE